MLIWEKSRLMGKLCLGIAILVLIPTFFPAIGECQTATNPTSLATQVVDPTAPLKFFTLQDIYSPSIWGADDKQNEAGFRANVPHDAFGLQNIMRVTVPYITSSPSGYRGLDDVTLLNIFVYPKKWGSIAAGGDISLGRNKVPGIDTFAIGPALAVVARKKNWTYGVLNQNFLSFGDIATSQLQPVLAYTFSDKFSLAYGDAQYTIDWKNSRFVRVPLSAELNFISSIPHQTVRYFVNPQYNVVNETGTRKWSITGGVSFIVK